MVFFPRKTVTPTTAGGGGGDLVWNSWNRKDLHHLELITYTSWNSSIIAMSDQRLTNLFE